MTVRLLLIFVVISGIFIGLGVVTESHGFTIAGSIFMMICCVILTIDNYQ